MRRTKPKIVFAEDAKSSGEKREVVAAASQAEEKKEEDSCTVYVSRLPRGFFEPQLRHFFGQFGTVNAVKLGRNKKTGHTQHWAFVEFANPDVARIAAAAMDKYILARQRLAARLAHEGIGKLRVSHRVRPRKHLFQRTNAHCDMIEKALADKDAAAKRLLANEMKRRAALQKAGVEYDFPGFQELVK
jgi:nucleolar protein 15